MNSKEIIKKVIEFDSPPRIGLDFNEPNQKDIAWIISTRYQNRYGHKSEWGYHEDDLKLVPDFKGEVRRDCWGNIYGRLEQKTKGECIKGALEDGWELLDDYKFPTIDESYDEEVKEILIQNKDRYLLAPLGIAVFSTIRDLRKIDNLLMDTILEVDNLVKFLERLKIFALELIERAKKNGNDAVITYDDWGTQKSLLISPEVFRKVFKPVYAELATRAHELGMKFFVHSCGFVYEIIEDFIEAGVDVLQFDQPELVGVETLVREFGGRVTFWCPVDIQKIMKTGDKHVIQESAKKMIDCFGRFNGGFIAKDYPTWEDIDVCDKWAQWARDIFIENAENTTII